MSIKIYGESALPTNIKVNGTRPRPTVVPADIRALVNRPTWIATINGYLLNGFDWCKWVPPKVARFPHGYIPNEKFIENFLEGPDGRLRALLDGDHRKHMYALAFPTATTMPAQLIDVRDEEHYHELFYEINFKNRKNANPNEVFLHLYLSGTVDAIKVANILLYCGVGVQGSPEPGGTVGCDTAALVNVSNLKTALKVANDNCDALKEACEDIMSTWSFTPGETKIAGDLLGGVAVIRDQYPEIANSKKLEAEFQKWLAAQSGYTMKDVARDLKVKGGDVGNKQAESVAYGIVKDFRKFNGGCITTKRKRDVIHESRAAKLLE